MFKKEKVLCVFSISEADVERRLFLNSHTSVIRAKCQIVSPCFGSEYGFIQY